MGVIDFRVIINRTNKFHVKIITFQINRSDGLFSSTNSAVSFPTISGSYVVLLAH